MAFENLISSALASLRGFAGADITYRRRGKAPVVFKAVAGNSKLEMVGSDGVLSVIDSRDFLFASTDLVIDDEATKPIPGDEIDEVSDEKTYTYRVLDLGSDLCYRFSDFGRSQIRVHTRLVNEI